MICRCCFLVSHLFINMRSELRCNTSPHCFEDTQSWAPNLACAVIVTHTELMRALCPCAASLQAVATPAQPDPLGTLLNQNTNYANIIAGAHPDPIPNNLVNLLVENPLGPQLDAAFKALPSLEVRTSPPVRICKSYSSLVSPSRLCVQGIMPARSRMCSPCRWRTRETVLRFADARLACHAFSSRRQQGCVPACTA